MSLRAFHIFFMAVSVSLLAGLGVREARLFQASKSSPDLLFSIASFVLSVLLIAYLRWFIAKQKKASSS